MSSLVPQKRALRFARSRTDLQIENEVISLRKVCLNRYAISRVLKNKAIKISSSTVYNIFKRNGLNKLERVKSENLNFSNSKKIIMSKSGELVHIDLHHLASSITICNNNQPFERLLLEMAIRHKYTQPYRPQTNDKIERFWRILQADFWEGSFY